MQRELDAEARAPRLAGTAAGLEIEILGVNGTGSESGNAWMTDGRTIPWLQDTPSEDVWNTKWRVTWRDVVVLDAENRKLTVYNLTEHPLGVSANYEELKSILRRAAGRTAG